MQRRALRTSAHAKVLLTAQSMLSLQVSADGEEVLYKACINASITMLSIDHMRHSPHSTVNAVCTGVCRWRGGDV